MSNTSCILPWLHLYVNADGSVLPCCIGDYRYPLGDAKNSSIEEIWNNKNFKNLRYNMINGLESPHCNACYQSEKMTGNSARTHFNQKFKKYKFLQNFTQPDGYLEKMDFKYLDIRWSNICNFKCRTCCATFSSAWAKEDGNKNVYIFAGGNSNDKLYNELEPYFEGVEEFYFAGGEPLLTDKHYAILEKLITLGKTDVRLRYNSNLSKLKFKNKNVLDLWKHFSDIEIYASIDHYGEKAEYIREGTNWKQVEKNIRQIKEYTPHILLSTNSVISVLNVSTLNNFYNYILENNLYSKKYSPTLYTLIEPDFYNFSVINDNLKHKIIDELKTRNFDDNLNAQIDDVIQTLEKTNYNHENRNNFLEQTKTYDRKRNRNLLDYFPELKSI